MTDEKRAEEWREYYARTGDRPPRETLLFALERFEAEGRQGFAVDLGCGGARDTVELLRRGWSVLAVDAQASAIEQLLSRPDLARHGDRLQGLVSRFEAAHWPAADLVNSGFALPLCPKPEFLAMWARIRQSLTPGGRFSGHLYGDRDEWAGDPTNAHFSLAEMHDLLADYEVEHFREEEEDSTTPRGKTKHWHIFHIVARKPGVDEEAR
ncbi:MAG: class I SAM-dependent methyltransferase [Alphaproteobacteria bacterium]|jgi:SAM-dependent methyltransferase|nr:class I SAM-dependent methyltransferase [Alphaproteobacteria bacterium]MDP6563716.1 class I SAM-dependent methyltransferase [Alphaproteobacteria bacterium]MDP6816341.1 class I SAM-dependent methyltransferase [Alphaproteobacteria bacterium]